MANGRSTTLTEPDFRQAVETCLEEYNESRPYRTQARSAVMWPIRLEVVS